MERKLRARVISIVMMLALVFSTVMVSPISAEAAVKKPTKITMSDTKKSLYAGQKYTLKVKSVTPKNASKSVTYKTSNAKVATVNAKGQVAAKKEGTATITVRSKVNSKVKATCKITVKQPVKKIVISDSKKTLYTGQKYTLKVKSVTPKNTSKSVTYKTSNAKIATVNTKGQIVAKKKGTATITVVSKTNSKAKAVCRITVKQPVKKITVTNAVSNKVVVRIGKKLALKTSISPTDASSKTVTYKSSNTKIVTVDKKGNIAGKKAGKAKITITSTDKKAKTTVNVTVPSSSKVVKKVTASPTKKTITIGQKFTLKAKITPSNAVVKTVTFKSSNTKVATVSSKGLVTGKKAGTAKITITSLDGAVKGTCTVTVKPVRVSSVKMSVTSASLNVNGTIALKAAVAPSNATNKAIKWSSSNTAVATVNTAGKVTAKKLGTAVITATAADGSGKKAACTITVKPILVSSVTLSRTSAELNINGILTLTASTAPSNATNKAVKWSSSNTAAAVVDSVGKVTAKSAGTAVITATAADGSGKKATCTITVKNPVIAITSVTLPASMELYANQTDAKLTAAVVPANTTMSKDIEFISSDKNLLEVNEDGTLVPNMANLVLREENSVTINVTAKAENGVSAVCAVTIILKEKANGTGDAAYTLQLDKKAETIDITRNGKTIAVTPESIGKDIATLTGIQWSNTTLKDNWNNQEIQNLLGRLVLAEELGLENQMQIDVNDAVTMTVTGNSKTVQIIRTDHEDGTSSLQISSNGKVLNLNNISVSEEQEKYVIETAAVSGSQNFKMKIEAAKDGSYVKMIQVHNNETTSEVVSVISDQNAYNISINKSIYLNILDAVGISDPIPEMVINNCYASAE